MNHLTTAKGAFNLAVSLAGGGKAWPSVTFLITMRCNAACPYCDFPRIGFEELGTLESLAIIRALRDAGTIRLGISGGEPLLRDDFGPIAREAKRCGFITSMVTNGVLLQERLEDTGPVDYVLCTFEGDEALHEKIRGKGTWRKALKGLEVLRSRGKRKLGIISPLHQENCMYIDETVRLAEGLGAKAFFQPVQTRNGWVGPRFEGALARKAEIDAFRRLLYLKHSGRAVGNSERYIQLMISGGAKDSLQKCVAGRFVVTILPDGRVTPCCMLPFQHSTVKVDPRNIRRTMKAVGTPACAGCTISPYVENNLILNLDWRTLGNALSW